MANTKLPARLLDTSAIPALNVTGDLAVDTTTLKVDSTNNRVGIGIASPDALLHISATSPHIDIGPQGGNRGKIGYHSNDVIIGSTSSTGNIIFKNNISSTDSPQTSGDVKMTIADVGLTIHSDTYNILNLQTDSNNDQTSTDGIIKITNNDGSSDVTKAEFRWDESEDLVHVSYGDHGRHVSINSTGKVGIGTGSTSPTATLEVAGTALVESAKLKAIAESNSDTAVDVFVYDTRKDSDGGAWRKRTQNTSWYNETLNTATRGARKEFPCVAVIVALGSSGNNVTIYDGDDPDLPMWMKFTLLNQDQVSISAMNGIVCLGNKWAANSGYGGNGIVVFEFVADRSRHGLDNATVPSYDPERLGVISGNQADTSIWPKTAGNAARFYDIVNTSVNDVSLTVLPNAPVDIATGLPVPTIAVATNGGVSIIKDDGSVVDITNSQDSSAFNYIDNLFFRKDGALVWVGDSATNTAAERFLQVIHNLPTTDKNQGSVENSSYIDEQYGPSHKNGSELRWATTAGVKATSDAGENFAVGTSGALHLLKYNREVEQEGAIAHITSDYNTGYMLGDIKLATLSDTSTTNVTGGTQPDRSYNNNALTVNGTVTKTAVATGADLVGYTGWSLSNYLEQPYNSDLNFSTGGYSIAVWVNRDSGSALRYVYCRGTADATETIRLGIQDAGVYFDYGNGSAYTQTNIAFPNTVWTHVVCTVSAGVKGKVYVNGIEQTYSVNNVAPSPLMNDTDYTSLIGRHYNNDSALVFSGDIALLRISATAPTEEQIKKIYNDEKHLFQENAKATLYGSSDAVTALAYDDDTELLHVGTSAGRSEFQGLRRINNTTDAVGTAISASNGLVVED